MESDGSTFDWKSLKQELEEAWRSIPKPFRTERSIHGTLQCNLHHWLRRLGHVAVADFMPPRVQDRVIDIIALNDSNEVLYAICIDTVVTLSAVKSLSSFEAGERLILTTGSLEKKVQESRFFLKPGVDHMHLQPFDQSS